MKVNFVYFLELFLEHYVVYFVTNHVKDVMGMGVFFFVLLTTIYYFYKLYLLLLQQNFRKKIL